MDGLRPEVDELDRFKNRSVSKAKVDNRKNSSKGKPSPPIDTSTKTASSSMPLTFFVLFFVCLSTAFAWFSWKQQIEITSLKSHLNEASGFMDQNKLLVARLEGKLSEKIWIISYQKH